MSPRLCSERSTYFYMDSINRIAVETLSHTCVSNVRMCLVHAGIFMPIPGLAGLAYPFDNTPLQPRFTFVRMISIPGCVLVLVVGPETARQARVSRALISDTCMYVQTPKCRGRLWIGAVSVSRSRTW